MSKIKYPIGIDLGTVNSAVAVCINNKVEIIHCQGYRITPSEVFYDPNDEENIIVGNLDSNDVRRYPANAIRDSKRFIGRSFNDPWVKDNSSNYSFKIESTESNGIRIPIQQNGKTVYKTPQEVSSEILKVLKNAASEYLGYTVLEAVITVPAYFTFSQRNATKQAAELAGLHVLMLLNEPTAACLYYVTERCQQDNLSLVFDLGGGTLDISIVRFGTNDLKVVAVDGDTLLGGRNFDEQTLENIINSSKLKLDERQRKRLLRAVEFVKHKLSFRENVSKEIENFKGTDGFTIKLNRTEFENINSNLFEKCLDIIKRCLTKAYIRKEKIDQIILVGGSTRIPKIKQVIRNFFEKQEILTNVNPDEAVACGAAIQAASLKDLGTALYKIVDVTPFSLGVNVLFGKMETVMKCNTPVPAKKSTTLLTSNNYQTAVPFKIYEGERSRTKLNNFLGKFIINNLPSKPAEQVIMLVTFSIDESGLLKVTAKENSTDVTAELEIGVELHDLKSNNIISLVNEIKEDEEFLEFVGKLKHLRYPCVKYICDKDDNEVDVKECKKFIADLEALEFEERGKLNGLVESFKKQIRNTTLINEIS